ncbi:MAG: hypothetical protein H6742_13725 [Alphaproteobacteria bacterium]|nr:hypothetical protein [Alphaproteobacteria bacterium]
MAPIGRTQAGTGAERGSAAIIAAVSFVVLCGFGALVIDLGYAGMVEGQLQTTADAASLAGARVLDGTDDGLVAARDTAVAIGELNPANGEVVTLDRNDANDPAGDIVLGVWDGANFTASTTATAVNAVQVRARRPDLTSFLSRVAFGVENLDVGAQATAISGPLGGAGKVPWYLPFGLPECLFDTFDDETLQDMEFKLSPAGVDNTGWAAIGDTTNANFLKNHFAATSTCMKEWAYEGDISDDCTAASVEENVDLHNGAVDSVLNYIGNNIATDGIPWGDVPGDWGTQPAQHAGSRISSSDYGYVYVGAIPIFESGPEYCTSAGAWTETVPIKGFVMAILYDVTGGSAANKNVYVRIDVKTDYDVGVAYGGSDYGVQAETPSTLVK